MIADDAERTAQQAAVLAALQDGPKTTLDLRQAGVMHPAGRVLELRRQGHAIATAKRNRTALYSLARDAVTGAACIAGLAVVLGAAQAGGLPL